MEFACAEEEMAIRDEFKTYVSEQIAAAIEQSIKSFEPRGWKKAAFWLRQIGPILGIIAVCLTLIGLLITAITFAVNQHSAATTRIANEATFETKTDDRLGRLETDMVSLRALVAANQPLRKQNQDAAKSLLAEVRQKAIPPIPEKVVAQAGNSFVEAAQTEPKAWDVALDFIAYRSTLNITFTPKGKISPMPPATWKYETRSIPGKPLPKMAFSALGVEPNEAAKYDLIGKDLNKALNLGPLFLIVHDSSVLLDAEHIKNTVFENEEVHYNGGPLILENVVFINCTFVIDNNPPGRNLGSQMLASVSVNFKNPA